jgi:hypothetical protein
MVTRVIVHPDEGGIIRLKCGDADLELQIDPGPEGPPPKPPPHEPPPTPPPTGAGRTKARLGGSGGRNEVTDVWRTRDLVASVYLVPKMFSTSFGTPGYRPSPFRRFSFNDPRFNIEDIDDIVSRAILETGPETLSPSILVEADALDVHLLHSLSKAIATQAHDKSVNLLVDLQNPESTT